MALGILMIIFIVLIIVAVILQILLYVQKDNTKISIYIANTLLGIIISIITFTALPSNFTAQKSLALIWLSLAVLAIIFKLANRKFAMLSKIMLSIAVFGSLVQLLLF